MLKANTLTEFSASGKFGKKILERQHDSELQQAAISDTTVGGRKTL